MDLEKLHREESGRILATLIRLKAAEAYRRALMLATNDIERRFLRRRLTALTV
jgi:predicted RNA polymerase sigma factor